MRDPSGTDAGARCATGRGENFATYSLKRLGIRGDRRVSPGAARSDVPIEETVGAIADLIKAGHVKHVGLRSGGRHDPARARGPDRGCADGILVRDPDAGGEDLSGAPRARKRDALRRARARTSSGSKPTPRYVRAHSRASQAKRARTTRRSWRSCTPSAKLQLLPAQLCIAWALTQQPALVPLSGARKHTRTEPLSSDNRAYCSQHTEVDADRHEACSAINSAMPNAQ